jgi:hypothetical protein
MFDKFHTSESYKFFQKYARAKTLSDKQRLVQHFKKHIDLLDLDSKRQVLAACRWHFKVYPNLSNFV